MTKQKNLLAAVLSAILFLIPVAAQTAPVGKITNIQGNVDITVAGKAARNALPGEAVNVGDFIRTKSKSKVEITFNEGNILRMAENSRVGITEYMSGKKQNSSVFNLFRGKIQNIVKTVGSAGGRYEVHTPTSVCGVRGTHFFNFYLAGASGSIFQEGTGYGYSKNNSKDVKTITAGQGMFVPGPALGAQLRNISNQQLDEMKNATEISRPSGDPGDSGSDDSANSGSTGGSGSSDSSAGTGGSGGSDTSSSAGDSNSMGDSGSSNSSDTSGSTSDTPPPSPTTSSLTTAMVIPPPVQPLQSFDTLSLNITPAASFDHTIDGGGTINGTTTDGGTTFSLTVSGGMYGTADYPGAGLIDGSITNGSSTISGISGYMMGLPNASQTGARALVSTIYVNGDGQAGFLLGPLTATFAPSTFSGSGLAYKYAPVAATGFTPTTLGLSTFADVSVPAFGNIYIPSAGGYANLSCSSATCESEARGIDIGGGKIGVWGSSSYNGSYYNDGNFTSFSNNRVIICDSIKKAVLYSKDLSGAVDPGAKDVSLSGDFLYLSTLYNGKLAMNHFGYYDNSNNYTSISSGIFQLQPMAFANELSSPLSGIMGSIYSLWTNTSVPVAMAGKYSVSNVYNIISGGWESQNYAGGGILTNDSGGAYKGYTNTLITAPPSGTGILSTDAQGLYADVSGNIGILRGNIAGTVYTDMSGFEAEGALSRIQLAAGTAITPNILAALSPATFTMGASVNNLISSGPNLLLTSLTTNELSFSNSFFGVGKTIVSGNYSGTPTGNAAFSYNLAASAGIEYVYVQNFDSTYTAGTGGYFQGNIAGAGANWTSASTYVFGGTIKGTYDSTTTWNATSLISRIETAAFIDLASTDAGRAKLASLNVPYVQVGTATLSGTAGSNNISINNVNFYAYSSGAAPRIWASNSVTGNCPAVVPGTTTVPLTGGGLSANFLIQQWSGNRWTANIQNGTGGFNGSTKFEGGAAGTYNASLITSGTASGIAH